MASTLVSNFDDIWLEWPQGTSPFHPQPEIRSLEVLQLPTSSPTPSWASIHALRPPQRIRTDLDWLNIRGGRWCLPYSSVRSYSCPAIHTTSFPPFLEHHGIRLLPAYTLWRHQRKQLLLQLGRSPYSPCQVPRALCGKSIRKDDTKLLLPHRGLPRVLDQQSYRRSHLQSNQQKPTARTFLDPSLVGLRHNQIWDPSSCTEGIKHQSQHGEPLGSIRLKIDGGHSSRRNCASLQRSFRVFFQKWQIRHNFSRECKWGGKVLNCLLRAADRLSALLQLLIDLLACYFININGYEN